MEQHETHHHVETPEEIAAIKAAAEFTRRREKVLLAVATPDQRLRTFRIQQIVELRRLAAHGEATDRQLMEQEAQTTQEDTDTQTS